MRRLLAVLAILAMGASAWGVTGAVVDSKGRPVAGAKLAIWTFWTFDRTFHADSKGEFVYIKSSDWDGTVSVQTYTIVDAGGKPVPKATVTMPWYNEVPLTFHTNKLGQFDYPFPADTKGKLRILDSKGAPVPHAKAISRGRFSDNEATITDENGEFSYPALQKIKKNIKRELRVHATAAGYAYGASYFTQGQPGPLVIKLWPEQVLKAKIVGEDGAPLRGASVCLNDLNGQKAINGFDSAGYDIMPVPIITAKDGSFSLHHLPSPAVAKSADVRLTIFAAGRCHIERVFDLAELRKSGKIVLPRMCALQGTIKPPVSGPLPDSLTLVMKLREKYGPSTPSEHYAYADKSGKFKFDKLPPGTAMIRLLAPRRHDLGWVLPAVRDIRIAPGEVKNYSFVGTTGALISGTVRDKATGNPISTAVLNLQDATNPDGETLMSDETITDKDGNYSARVAAGKASVHLQFYFVNNKTVRYLDKDQPVVSIVASDGENKSGLDLTVSPPANQPKEIEMPDLD